MSEQDRRLAEIGEREARRARLEEDHGMPRRLQAADAVALARAAGTEVPDSFSLDCMSAHIYRDTAAADAWLASNFENYGHPVLFRATLPDGQVIGVLDLRPAMERARRETEARG